MPNGGQAWIETTNVELQDSRIRAYDGPAADQYVMISISDTRHGIVAEDLNKVFEPFYTTWATSARAPASDSARSTVL